jgi:hypothetical protein
MKRTGSHADGNSDNSQNETITELPARSAEGNSHVEGAKRQVLQQYVFVHNRLLSLVLVLK